MSAIEIAVDRRTTVFFDSDEVRMVEYSPAGEWPAALIITLKDQFQVKIADSFVSAARNKLIEAGVLG